MKKANISEGDRNKTISGSLSSLFHHLTMTDECRKNAYMQLLGSPIEDENDKVVGKITCIDIDNDRWYAEYNVNILGENYERK